MKRILVLQHLAVEHPGIFRDYMREAGIAWDTVELDEGDALPTLARYDAVIAMGGPMDVWDEDELPWLRAEKAVIHEAVAERKLPYLGVCLGHQLLADALGGAVDRAEQGEVGVLDVALTDAGVASPLFAGFPRTFATLQWHGAEVLRAPEGAEVLASSLACPVQALAVGEHAYSIQFHVEVTDTTVGDWADVPAYRESLEATFGPGGVDGFRDAVAAKLADMNRLARRLWDNWLRAAG